MNRTLMTLVLVASTSLIACNKPEVVAVPTPVPGPAGPPGPAGSAGDTGAKGSTGDTGNGTTVVVTPPAASAPAY